MPWVLDPHTGGNKIPDATRRQTIARIERYAAEHLAGRFTRLDIRIRGPLCYVDAFCEPEEPTAELLKLTQETREQFMERLRNDPVHLCRLRHFDLERWSFALFTYSNEKYSPCILDSGSFIGTIEEVMAVAGPMYLLERM